MHELPVGVIGHMVQRYGDDPASCLGRLVALPKEAAGHTSVELLLYSVIDQLAVANWQRSKDGAKSNKRPKPISPLAAGQSKRHGGTTRPQAQVHEMLARMRPQPVAEPTDDDDEPVRPVPRLVVQPADEPQDDPSPDVL